MYLVHKVAYEYAEYKWSQNRSLRHSGIYFIWMTTPHTLLMFWFPFIRSFFKIQVNHLNWVTCTCYLYCICPNCNTLQKIAPNNFIADADINCRENYRTRFLKNVWKFDFSFTITKFKMHNCYIQCPLAFGSPEQANGSSWTFFNEYKFQIVWNWRKRSTYYDYQDIPTLYNPSELAYVWRDDLRNCTKKYVSVLLKLQNG